GCRKAKGPSVSRGAITRRASDWSVLGRVGHCVYHLTGAPAPDQLALRVAWLQLAPEVPDWQRTPAQGAVSHRSAPALYGIGHLPADRHEFTVAARQRSRRPDVRLHVGQLSDGDWIPLRGLTGTRPAR